MYPSLPSIAVTVPTWKRGEMFRQCVQSLLDQTYEGHIEIMCVVDYESLFWEKKSHTEVDDAGVTHIVSTHTAKSGDLGIAEDLQKLATSGTFAGLRSVRIKRGPGRSNWRPGSIHFPVFEHWLQTKCDLVTYQFSDEWSGPMRFERQVRAMLNMGTLWSYCGYVHFANAQGEQTGVKQYTFRRELVPTNQLMTPSIIVDRKAFEEVGGLDCPIHAAAKAEEWIQTHCAIVGKPVCQADGQMYYFRHHAESLGNDQKPKSKAYEEAIAETGFVEDDHWRLWNRIKPMYDSRIEIARRKT